MTTAVLAPSPAEIGVTVAAALRCAALPLEGSAEWMLLDIVRLGSKTLGSGFTTVVLLVLMLKSLRFRLTGWIIPLPAGTIIE
jgi:hypothetical protein